MTITLDELTKAEPKRDRYGRPLIVPRDGGKPKAYTRPTTIADTLDDRYNLELWKQRQVLLGTVARPDLHALAATTAPDDKKALNKLCEQLMDAAASSAGANMGTAVHAAVEAWNRGNDYPEMFATDVVAYVNALQLADAAIDRDHVEQFVVNDTVGAAGTFDMRLRIGDTWYIADLKTGSTVEWSAKAFAIQLAIYAGHTSTYYWATETHGDPLPVDQSKGIIVHLPAGSGECTLHWLDLDAGREALEHALWVRKWRGRKDLLTPVTVKDDPPAVTDAAATMTEDELVDTLKRRPKPAQGGTVAAEPSSPGTNSGTVERPSRGSRPARIEALVREWARRPDEGPDADPAHYARIQADGKALSKDALGLVLRWRAQPKGVWRWNTAGDDGRVSVRRVAITEVAMALAAFVVTTVRIEDDDAEWGDDPAVYEWRTIAARAALEEVMGDDVQSHPVGELLARLTVDECERMMEVLT